MYTSFPDPVYNSRCADFFNKMESKNQLRILKILPTICKAGIHLVLFSFLCFLDTFFPQCCFWHSIAIIKRATPHGNHISFSRTHEIPLNRFFLPSSCPNVSILVRSIYAYERVQLVGNDRVRKPHCAKLLLVAVVVFPVLP